MYYKVIKNVYEAFPGLPGKLAELTETSAEWWRSHGRPPETFNAHGTGKKLRQIEDILELVGLYEQAHKGAGMMLIEQLSFFVRAQYCDETPKIDGQALANQICKESTEAFLKVNTSLEQKTIPELEEIREEVRQSHDVHKNALEDLDRYICDRRARRDSYNTYILREGAAN